MRRRDALAWLAATPLAGCGFELQRAMVLPFHTLALTGFAKHSPLEAEFRRRLPDSVRVLANPAQAEVVLKALVDRRERSVVASTAAGQVREIELRLLFSARADTPSDRVLMAPVALRLTRDLSYIESAALAKQEEEGDLFREMQTDVVTQILRRLAAIHL